jgi:hypothetical protein
MAGPEATDAGLGTVAPELAGMLGRASGKDQLKLVMYSQGNLVSNQAELERSSSLILKLTLGVDGATGEPYLKKAEYIPTYTQRRDRQGVSHHTIWPLELALTPAAADSRIFGGGDQSSLPQAWKHITDSQPGLDLLLLAGEPVWAELTAPLGGPEGEATAASPR